MLPPFNSEGDYRHLIDLRTWKSGVNIGLFDKSPFRFAKWMTQQHSISQGLYVYLDHWWFNYRGTDHNPADLSEISILSRAKSEPLVKSRTNIKIRLDSAVRIPHEPTGISLLQIVKNDRHLTTEIPKAEAHVYSLNYKLITRLWSCERVIGQSQQRGYPPEDHQNQMLAWGIQIA